MRTNSRPKDRRPAPHAVAAWTIALLAGLIGLTGCGSGGSTMDPDPDPDPDPTEPTYAERVATAWTSFSAGNYTAARAGFAAAVAANPVPVDAYAGLGWSELELDHLDAAHQAFENGSGKTGADAIRADLFAGWSFVWNARTAAADHHAESNARIAEAEALAPDWVFPHRAGLDADDLTLLAAENFFALGAFDSSLLRVQVLDPLFDADIGTPEGQAVLAEKIEALRTGA